MTKGKGICEKVGRRGQGKAMWMGMGSGMGMGIGMETRMGMGIGTGNGNRNGNRNMLSTFFLVYSPVVCPKYILYVNCKRHGVV